MAKGPKPSSTQAEDQDTRYWAFISYSHQDVVFANKLHKRLERFSIPHRLRIESGDARSSSHLRPIFKDRQDLASASNLSQELQRALASSANLIVICSPHSANSQWVNAEITHFRSLGYGNRIFPIIVDGAPNSGNENECFPPALTQFEGSDLEPIAADARAEGDGFKDATLKLAAGLLGVEFDGLKRRAVRAFQQRMAALSLVATMVAAVTTGLAIYAFQQQDLAQTRSGQAEELISFMLGDLRQKLEDLGRLDVLDDVGDAANEYFRTVPVSQLNDHALQIQALTLRQVGEVRLGQGQVDAAYSYFATSLERWTELAMRDPNALDVIFEFGQAQFWVGSIHYQLGNQDEALGSFEDYLATSQRLYDLQPTVAAYELELLFAHSNLGAMAIDTNEHAKALGHFRSAEMIGLSLLNSEPTNPDYILESASTLSWLGRLAEESWELSAAIEKEHQVIELLNSIQGDNTPFHWKQLLADACYNVASLLWHRGELDTTLSNLNCAEIGFSSLVEHDPNNMLWRSRLVSIEAARLRLTDASEFEELANRIEPSLAMLPETSDTLRYELQFYATVLLGNMTAASAKLESALVKLDHPVNPQQLEALCHAEFALTVKTNLQDSQSKCLAAPEQALSMGAAAWTNLILLHNGQFDQSARLTEKLSSIGFKQPDYLNWLEQSPSSL